MKTSWLGIFSGRWSTMPVNKRMRLHEQFRFSGWNMVPKKVRKFTIGPNRPRPQLAILTGRRAWPNQTRTNFVGAPRLRG